MADGSFTGNESTPDYVPTSDEKRWLYYRTSATFIFTFIAPLIIYLVKRRVEIYSCMQRIA